VDIRSLCMYVKHSKVISVYYFASLICIRLPVWHGFLTVDLKNRIEALLKRLFRYGYLTELVSFSQLCECSLFDLFTKMQKVNRSVTSL